MRKILVLCLAFLFCFGVLYSFTACGEDESDLDFPQGKDFPQDDGVFRPLYLIDRVDKNAGLLKNSYAGLGKIAGHSFVGVSLKGESYAVLYTYGADGMPNTVSLRSTSETKVWTLSYEGETARAERSDGREVQLTFHENGNVKQLLFTGGGLLDMCFSYDAYGRLTEYFKNGDYGRFTYGDDRSVSHVWRLEEAKLFCNEKGYPVLDESGAYRTSWTYDERGYLTEVVSGKWVYRYENAENGNLMKEIGTCAFEDGRKRECEYRYDDTERKIWSCDTSYRADGTLSEREETTIEYGAAGSKTVTEQSVSYHTDGSVLQKEENRFEYGEDGKIFLHVLRKFDSDGTLLYEAQYELTNGKETKRISTSFYADGRKTVSVWSQDETGRLIEDTLISYDTDGNVTEQTLKTWEYFDNGGQKETAILSYADGSGTETVQIKQSHEEGESISYISVQYGAGGVMTQKSLRDSVWDFEGKFLRDVTVIYNPHDGTVQRSFATEREYDEQGAIRRDTTVYYYADGSVDHTLVTDFVMNENGDVLSTLATTYNADGSVCEKEFAQHIYDEKGKLNKIVYTNYDGAGNVTKQYEIVYS